MAEVPHFLEKSRLEDDRFGDGTDPARSALMARVRSKNTSPELRVRCFLHAGGLRYRLHYKRILGSPDIAFPSRRVAVYVHGCFWHRHAGCPATRTPKSKTAFWSKKFTDNVARDSRTLDGVAAAGWTAIVIWECQTKDVAFLATLRETVRNLPQYSSVRR